MYDPITQLVIATRRAFRANIRSNVSVAPEGEKTKISFVVTFATPDEKFDEIFAYAKEHARANNIDDSIVFGIQRGL